VHVLIEQKLKPVELYFYTFYSVRNIIYFWICLLITNKTTSQIFVVGLILQLFFIATKSTAAPGGNGGGSAGGQGGQVPAGYYSQGGGGGGGGSNYGSGIGGSGIGGTPPYYGIGGAGGGQNANGANGNSGTWMYSGSGGGGGGNFGGGGGGGSSSICCSSLYGNGGNGYGTGSSVGYITSGLGGIGSVVGSGAGGNGGIAVFTNLLLTNNANYLIVGGAGGGGGGSQSLQGGSGGNGGYAIQTTASVINYGVIIGGNGGGGGGGGAGLAYNSGSGGSGGNGGVGVSSSNSNLINNTGAQIIGGNGGGVGGISDDSPHILVSTPGNGGAGVNILNGSINNSGTIIGGDSGTGIVSGVGVSGQGGAGIFANNANINNSGSIKGGTWSGIYTGTNGDGILVAGGSNLITNTGSITVSPNAYQIHNTAGVGGIYQLNNAQGGNSSDATTTALTYSGALPSAYNIIINSTSHYGQLKVSGASGTMAFGIDASSVASVGTYTDVLQGFGSGASPTGVTQTTGTFGTFGYSFVQDTSNSGYWNLVLIQEASPGTTINANNLTGNPVLSGGTLDMNQANTSYSNNFTVSNTASTINQSGNVSTFDGIFSNAAGQAGKLVISNSGNGGAVVFNAANTYTGTTEVSNGAKLVVNGSITSATTVDAGGTLSGTGSLGSVTVADGGILAPGSFGSVGRMTINGNLVLDADPAITNITVSGTSSSQINVSGTASLGGALNVNGSYPAAAYLPTTKYTILTATGGISGTYGSLNTGLNYTFLTPTLYYGSNDVTLGFALTPFSTVAKNINQRNVGNALTIAALGPVNSLGAPILNALFSGNYQNAQAVMDTVGGSGLAGVQSTAMQVGEMASSSVSDQIAFWRSGETMDVMGRTSQEGNNPRNFLAYAATNTKAPAKGLVSVKGPAGDLAAAVAPRTFRAWGSMFGGGANYLSDAGRGAAASNIGYYGGLIGVDYQIQPNILVGVAVGGSSSNFNVGSLSTNGNLTGFHAGVYGAYTMGNSYVALNETFSAYTNQTTRKAGGYAYLPYEQLSAQFGSTEFRTRGELGHGVLMGGLKATPFVAAEIAAYQSNAFSEQSSIYASTFALKNNGQGINSLPTFAGLRLSNAVTLSNGWRLAPVGSVAYVHEFFPQRQFNNMLISMPGTDFNVAGPRSTYNLVQTKIGAQLNLNEKLALFTDFQGEFSPVSQSYAGKGGVKYIW